MKHTPMPRYLLLVLFSISCAARALHVHVLQPLAESDLLSDCQALYRFGFRSTNAALKAGWSAQAAAANATWCCHASGVSCSIVPPGDQRVTALVLPGLGISGVLDDLSPLAWLTALQLESNALSGSLGALRGLTQLRQLQLSTNRFSGTIDPLSNLKQLELLGGYHNSLSGTLEPLGSLTSLNEVGLHVNHFSSTLDAVANLTQLEALFLFTNRLSGSIGPISKLTRMRELALFSNRFSGTLGAVSRLTALMKLDVNSNHMSGTIDAVSKLTALWELGLFSNQFSGKLTPLSNLTALQILNVDYNQFSGTLDDFAARLTRLGHIQAQVNRLSGTLDILRSIPQISGLSMNQNKFSGTLDPLAALTQLGGMTIIGNRISGTLEPLSDLSMLTSLAVRKNQLSGTISSFSTATGLVDLDLSFNLLSGDIAVLSPLANVLQTVDVSHNGLTAIGSPLGKYAQVNYLNFSHNLIRDASLSGSHDTPNPSSALPVVLDVSGNKFLCPFPVFPEHVLFTHSDCTYTEREYITYGVIVAVVACAVAAVLLMQRRLRNWYKVALQSRSPIAVYAAVKVAWLWFALVNDSVVEADMVRYLLSPKTYCARVNSPSLFSTHVSIFSCDGVTPLGSSFAEYVTSVLQSSCRWSDSLVQRTIVTPFATFCSGFPACSYLPAPAYRCAETSPDAVAYQGHYLFFVAVLVVMVLRALVLVFSLHAVLRLSRRKRPDRAGATDVCPSWVYDVASNSWFSPLAVLEVPAGARLPTFLELIVFRPSFFDLYFRLLHSTLLFQLPHVVLTAYYALHVVQTGFSNLAVLSIFSAMVAVCIAVGRATYGWCSGSRRGTGQEWTSGAVAQPLVTHPVDDSEGTQ